MPRVSRAKRKRRAISYRLHAIKKEGQQLGESAARFVNVSLRTMSSKELFSSEYLLYWKKLITFAA
jgi:hypothetical protein